MYIDRPTQRHLYGTSGVVECSSQVTDLLVETTFSMTAMVGGEDDEALAAGVVDDTKKSERKRKRERQRRSDLTNALDELAALVSQIDPDEQSDSGTAQKKRRRKSGESEAASAAAIDVDSASMTRLDLIGRTTTVLRRLQRENADLRRRLEEQKSRSGGDDKEVLVMVPTLTMAEHQDHPSRSAPQLYPQPYYHHHQHAPHPEPPQPLPPPYGHGSPPPQQLHMGGGGGGHYYGSGGGAPYLLPPYGSGVGSAPSWGSVSPHSGTGIAGSGGVPLPPPPPDPYGSVHYPPPSQDTNRGLGGGHSGPPQDDHGSRRDTYDDRAGR